MSRLQHLVPQFDPGAEDTEITLVAATAQEVAIPTLTNGDKPKYVMLTTDLDEPVSCKVGIAGVDVGSHPHFILSKHSGPFIINVTGQAKIDFLSAGVNVVIMAPLSNDGGLG